MKAIILAAGRGSRMKEITDQVPKCLIKVNNQTLLDQQIQALNDAGISEIGIVTGYKRELLTSIVKNEFFNSRWAETNMVSSLECASSWLENFECIVSYSDIFYSKQAVLDLKSCSDSLAITYDVNWRNLWGKRFSDPLMDAETFLLDDKGYILEIGNKPKSLDEIQGQYMGLLRFTPKSWKVFQQFRSTLSQNERDNMHMTGTLQALINSKKILIKALPYIGAWGEFDSQDDLKL